MADLIEIFCRDVAKKIYIERRFDDVFGFHQKWDAQFEAGLESDIYEVNGGYAFPKARERFVDLRPYLARKNPFTGKRWKDSFRSEALFYMGARNRKAAVPFILVDYSAPAINVNIDLVESVGGAYPINTFAEWLDVCRKARDADYQWPIAAWHVKGSSGLDFYVHSIQDMLWRRLAVELDYNEDGIADMFSAIRNRKFNHKLPEVRAFAELFKNLSQYFIWYFDRYDSLDVKPYYFSRRPQCLFRSGDFRRTRMDGDSYRCVRDGKRQFPFREGAMPIPEITRESSLYASGPSRGLLGPSLHLGIATRTQREGTFDECLKFLQWFTTAENQRFFISYSRSLSAIKHVPFPEGWECFPYSPDDPRILEPRSIWYSGLTAPAKDRFFDAIVNLARPTGTVDEFISDLKETIALDRL
ncbi:MAG: extracellular solute-binding protein [Planctomycetes bacterium]|nr:extracellular solute-binding protein [Planctomycetota bacterium]